MPVSIGQYLDGTPFNAFATPNPQKILHAWRQERTLMSTMATVASTVEASASPSYPYRKVYLSVSPPQW